eukprot:1161841-Pelagomonas_calceolata.AAC.11
MAICGLASQLWEPGRTAGGWGNPSTSTSFELVVLFTPHCPVFALRCSLGLIACVGLVRQPLCCAAHLGSLHVLASSDSLFVVLLTWAHCMCWPRQIASVLCCSLGLIACVGLVRQPLRCATHLGSLHLIYY